MLGTTTDTLWQVYIKGVTNGMRTVAPMGRLEVATDVDGPTGVEPVALLLVEVGTKVTGAGETALPDDAGKQQPGQSLDGPVAN